MVRDRVRVRVRVSVKIRVRVRCECKGRRLVGAGASQKPANNYRARANQSGLSG